MADGKRSKMARDLWHPKGRIWSHHYAPIEPIPSSHQSAGCTGIWENASARSRLIKSAQQPQACTMATASSNFVYLCVPHPWCI